MHNSSSTFEQKQEGTYRISRTEVRENTLGSLAADGATLLSAARYDSCHKQQAWQNKAEIVSPAHIESRSGLTRYPTEAT